MQLATVHEQTTQSEEVGEKAVAGAKKRKKNRKQEPELTQMPLSRLPLQRILLSLTSCRRVPVHTGARVGGDLVRRDVVSMYRVRLLDVEITFAFAEDFVL